MNRRHILNTFAFSLCALLHPSPAQADVKLPAIFSDHAVLQQGVSLPIWGWADPSEEVTVSLGKQKQTATTGAEGKWAVKLNAMETGGPLTLTVKGKNTLTVNDVLVGEVWLGSGQSNMAMQVARAQNFDQEKAAANLPEIRIFTVANNAATSPAANCKGEWKVCSPETVGTFSATAYFFGREIHRELKVPVGLLNSSVGGTPIESWIDPQVQRATPDLKGFFEARATPAIDLEAEKAKYEAELAAWKAAAQAARATGQPVPRTPRNPAEVRQRKGNVGGLYHGMIAPLVPYAIRGGVWYQGEANSSDDKAPFYHTQLSLLVTDWRKKWGFEFPMAWVQLPNFTRAGDGWSLVREGMLKTLELPKTGMAIAIDIGDPKNIHPVNKQEIGRRLSLWALNTVYGRKGVWSGPLPAGHQIRRSEIVLSFTHGEGLKARGGELKGFTIAGADKKWLPAQARIAEGEVILSHPEVKEPVAARYAWADNPECNLYNAAGLPASPFRTDNWPAPKVTPATRR